jgi:DNA-binding LytR/AlgR family response regulator
MSALRGKRILVLEDEFLLALEAAETLQEIGADVIGPAHRVEAAFDMLAAQQPDAALLDVNINGATSAAVARCLADQRIPFVLATGYGNLSGITGEFAVIDKPYNREQLQAAFLRLFGSPAPATRDGCILEA